MVNNYTVSTAVAAASAVTESLNQNIPNSVRDENYWFTSSELVLGITPKTSQGDWIGG